MGDGEQTLLRPNVNLLLGDNGSGKTSILRAIALAVLAPVIEGAGYVPYRMVRRTATTRAQESLIKGNLLLHDQDIGTRTGPDPFVLSQHTTKITRIHDVEKVSSASRGKMQPWDKMYDNRSPAFFIVGYGAGRRVEDDKSFNSTSRLKSRLLRYDRVAGLFEDAVTLTPLSAWLPELSVENKGRYKQVENLINRLLPEDCRFNGEREQSDYVFQFRGSPVTFPALSEGYRAYIGWIADLLYHVCMGCPSGAKLVENRGIVLVDEIDLYLHPEWQRRVVPDLSTALPNLQFVVTSHSPLVAGTLQSRNIILMDQDQSGATVPTRIDERIHGLSAEQILLSTYFGLKTTRDQDAVDELIALSRRVQDDDPHAALAFLRRLRGQSGDSESQDAGSGAPKPSGGTKKTLSTVRRRKTKKPAKRATPPAGEPDE